MQVVVDSLLTHYEVRGEGKVILLLHGWADSAAGLSSLQKALSEKYKVVALDLPGFGTTQAPKSVWGLSDYAQFVAHFLDKIAVKDVSVIVGHSNGGAMAIRGLGEGTLKADKLVLLASAGIRGVYKGRLKALRIVTKIGKALSSPLPKSVKRRLRAKVYKTVGSDMLVAEHLQETFKKVVTDDVREDAAKISQPVLLIYGETDEQAPVWYGEAYHQIMSNSTLEILPGAGHFVHLDRPEEVHKAVREFVAT
jgi:pimeloyl-ACP methyl ester carboxylesterase